MWFVTVGSGFLADWMRSRRILSTTNVRKLANSLGESDYVLFALCGRPTFGRYIAYRINETFCMRLSRNGTAMCSLSSDFHHPKISHFVYALE